VELTEIEKLQQARQVFKTLVFNRQQLEYILGRKLTDKAWQAYETSELISASLFYSVGNCNVKNIVIFIAIFFYFSPLLARHTPSPFAEGILTIQAIYIQSTSCPTQRMNRQSIQRHSPT